ncbi:MAG TPA: amidohydrolase family protein [Candidatus Thermoplasmatota archaeon]|nr:amidohydrolase family protein [Candidatus Thermoplasmatota archaeon]
MTLLAGSIRGPDGFFEGWLRVDDGRIARVGRGPPPSTPDLRGVVVPRPLNAHTHVGDHVARGLAPAGATLADLFEPPHGLKHRVLASTPPEALVEGMRRAISELAASGARAALDFREGGADGVALLAKARAPDAPRVLAFARPPPGSAPGDRRAIREALAESDGLGLSALRDVGIEAARAMAEEARAARQPVALHFSEAERESVEAALDLRPAFVVHGSHMTRDDLARLADDGVPLVVCPRSNLRLAKLVDLATARGAGVRIHLGTDNAMLQTLSPWEEARTLRDAGVAVDLALEALLGPATGFVLAGIDVTPVEEDAPAHLAVLAPQGTDPRAAMLGPSPPVLLGVVGEHP